MIWDEIGTHIAGSASANLRLSRHGARDGLSQSETFLPLSLECSDVARECDITLHIKGECMHALEALGSWHLVSVLKTESSVVDWKLGLSQDLAATSNSKNAFYSFICLACLDRYSLCTTTTSSVEEIVV